MLFFKEITIASDLLHSRYNNYFGFHILHKFIKTDRKTLTRVIFGGTSLSSCPVPLPSPPRAEFVKSECPSAALSCPSVRLYQRSLESRSSKYREVDEGDNAVSSLDTPVAKRKKTTAQGDTQTTQHTTNSSVTITNYLECTT